MSSPSNRSKKFLDGGGNIDTDALFHAYEEQGSADEEGLIEATFNIRKNLNRRLDSYLATRIPFLSRTSIKRLIEDESVTVNGKVPKGSTKVHQGDVVCVTLPPPPSSEIPAEDIPLKILFEDKDIIVLNKDDDIIIHPARSHKSGTIINALAWHFQHVSDGALSSVGEEFARPGVVHRLDRHTTGVMLAAKTDTAHWRLGKQFEKRQTRKRYLAVVHGEIEPLTDVIDIPLGKHPTKRDSYAVRWDETGKPSVTVFHVREIYDGYTLVELDLKTGRTHQIRLHLQHLGYPIVGDDIYGGKHLKVSDIIPRGHESELDRTSFVIQRQALHAGYLAFTHPISDEPAEFTAPLHGDMANLVKMLRKHRFKKAPKLQNTIIDLEYAVNYDS
ncbi:MAG: RluA family pseudouridine synthase [Phycisphaerae bacterium]|mgnify:FL=1|jgi:23S rRNA pseudouridine1911/1915/1917 synthase|nr:RluA family pseudouridine synthase [Phycisphaerae bacterium]MBT5408935.1 RluA family pseudouridine synthase [Phycisphaerae bacterium]MBT6165708.1 RluA family pseudouridine synthase [Phycisphaerae bacterium]MBT7658494.1 RluA family pseudouridine synthase [Phycisphaerae bacterium]